MKYPVITWILIVSVKTLPFWLCPEQCNCDGITMECHRKMPSFIPENVTSVVLYEFNFDNSLDFNDSGWLNVTQLSFNPGESVLKTRGDISVTLSSSMFKRLVNLEYIQIACRCLTHIGEGTFRGDDKLKVLDLSNNRLTRISFVNGLKGDGILPNLEELLYSHTSVADFGVLFVDQKFSNAVMNKPLKVLDLSRTSFLFLQNNAFFGAFSHLEKLNMSESGSAVASLFKVLFDHTIAFPGFQNLKSLDLSYPTELDQIVPPGDVTRKAYLLVSQLNELHFRKCLTKPLELFYDIRISVQGYTQNETLCGYMSVSKINSSYCILGNLDLDKIVFSENNISFVDPNIFKRWNKVKYFDLSKNILGDAFAAEEYVRSIIANLKRLEVLIVSGNGIYTIPDDAFENADMLQVLDLSNNELESVTFGTEKLTALQHLDLRQNKITVVDESSLQRLNVLKIQVVYITPVVYGSTNIELEGNPITCSCENRHYFNWTITYSENSTCLLGGVEKNIDRYILGHSYYLCKEKTVIVVYSLLAMIEFVVVVALVYFVLREIKATQLRRKIKRGIQRYRENRENRRNKPVFLSFCCEDDATVMKEIAPKLEEGLKKLLKTDSRCVATGYSDFRPGLSLADEIIRCVEESSVVIFFVTKAFCRKMWCRNEALIAYYENKPTILMIWEELNLNLMPKYLYHQYQHHTRIHWVQENGQRVMKPSWDKVCESVVSLFVEK